MPQHLAASVRIVPTRLPRQTRPLPCRSSPALSATGLQGIAASHESTLPKVPSLPPPSRIPPPAMCQSETLRNRKRERTEVCAAAATAPAPASAPAAPVRARYNLTRAVVSHHNSPNDAWVTHNGGVYDVTTFLESHPGGADVLLDRLGGDVSDVMAAGAHAHSAFAYKLLEKHRIGTLADESDSSAAADGNVDPVTGADLVDWGKPILPQVGALGDRYERWIHSFPTTDHTVKMFSNDIVENLTKCPWYVPLLFWIPVIAFELFRYTRIMGGMANISAMLFTVATGTGFVSWLLFEYVLHRFIFHLPTSTYYGNIFHFLVHGHHHITPMDFDRLVFPPVPAMIIASPFYFGAPRILGASFGYPWLVGLAVGYLVYDMTHFWIHHGVPTWSFFKMQKRRHVFHHYFDPDVNFGISNPLFDHVFRTLSEPERAE